MSGISRRRLGQLTAASLVAAPGPALAAIGDPGDYADPNSHLLARPRAEALVADDRKPGLRLLGLDRRRDAVLFTPAGLDWSRPVPLIVSLHGFSGTAYDGLSWFQAMATERKFLLLSPPSRGETWRMDAGPTGPDAAFLDKALDWVFRRFPVDPAHLAISGMSDGGSYSLCLGLQNGLLFSHVLAFSPLRFNAPDAEGKPLFLISTGRADDVAQLGNAEKMTAQLRALGYDVVLDIHNKGHVVTRQGVNAAMARFFG